MSPFRVCPPAKPVGGCMVIYTAEVSSCCGGGSGFRWSGCWRCVTPPFFFGPIVAYNGSTDVFLGSVPWIGLCHPRSTWLVVLLALEYWVPPTRSLLDLEWPLASAPTFSPPNCRCWPTCCWYSCCREASMGTCAFEESFRTRGLLSGPITFKPGRCIEVYGKPPCTSLWLNWWDNLSTRKLATSGALLACFMLFWTSWPGPICTLGWEKCPGGAPKGMDIGRPDFSEAGTISSSRTDDDIAMDKVLPEVLSTAFPERISTNGTDKTHTRHTVRNRTQRLKARQFNRSGTIGGLGQVRS